MVTNRKRTSVAVDSNDKQRLPVREKRRKVSFDADASSEDFAPETSPALQHSEDEVDVGEAIGFKKSKAQLANGGHSSLGQVKSMSRAAAYEDNESGTDGDSDDEAPEAVSTSKVQADIVATRAEEGRAQKMRDMEVRAKRRKRDARLKSQVKSSERRQQASEKKRASEANDAEDTERTEALPTFLPEELLASEAPVRPPTPPPVAATSNRVKRFSDENSADVPQTKPAPKDIVLNGTKVRMLQDTNTQLPPKGNETKAARERMLKGHAHDVKPNKRRTNVPAWRRRSTTVNFV